MDDITALGKKQFGDYNLVEEIARGGMGIVISKHCRASTTKTSLGQFFAKLNANNGCQKNIACQFYDNEWMLLKKMF